MEEKSDQSKLETVALRAIGRGVPLPKPEDIHFPDEYYLDKVTRSYHCTGSDLSFGRTALKLH